MKTEDGDSEPRMVVLGRITGLFGVRGWMKIYSHTAPRNNILNYDPWFIGRAGRWRECRLLDGHAQGKGIVASIQGCDSREQAAALMGSDIAVPRDQLAALEQDEYYWSDLEGLEVFTREGVSLGRVSHLFDTGANDVMVVKGERERLVPYIWDQVVKSVDLDAGRIQVEWDPEF